MPRHVTTSSVPPSPVGDDETAIWLKWVHEQIAHRLQLIDAPGIRFERTSRGVKPIITVARNGGGSAVATGTMIYVGEWLSTRAYAAQEVVTRGALGEFICVQAVAGGDIGTAPETGAPFWHGWAYPPNNVWA